MGVVFQVWPKQQVFILHYLCVQPISKEMFDDALKELQDEDYLIVTNKVIRLCS